MNLSTVQFSCTFIVGSIFLITAIIKAIDARQFIRHNLRYDLAKPKPIKLASITFITIESGLGLALILQIYLLWLIPFCLENGVIISRWNGNLPPQLLSLVSVDTLLLGEDKLLFDKR